MDLDHWKQLDSRALLSAEPEATHFLVILTWFEESDPVWDLTAT
jgi:hypothetical protein